VPILSSSDFLSHPKDNQKGAKLLLSHLIEVSEKARELVKETRFKKAQNATYLAGLLHDIGKLNPFYQILFHTDFMGREQKMHELRTLYQQQHSLLSAWAAKKLLGNMQGADRDTLSLLLCIIAAHHSQLTNDIMVEENDNKAVCTRKGTLENLEKFQNAASSDPRFSTLDWKGCLAEFSFPMSFRKLSPWTGNPVTDFMETNVAFSALLQADRGSFHQWELPLFNLQINTREMVNQSSPFSPLRTKFQEWYSHLHRYSDEISILHAPTGIGKTKVFLDTIEGYRNSIPSMRRVFYFSPLLALTDDFEKKLEKQKIVSESARKDVLIYNHLYAGSLASKIEHHNSFSSGAGWNFEYESFNSKFVITTTQRLIMTLYSNAHSDKLKLLSLGNSLLIVDEVQVIPKFLLPSLLELLERICKMMNSRVLLVSATMPHEIKSRMQIKELPDNLAAEYFRLAMKEVRFHSSLPRFAAPKDGNLLVMLNTRRKAQAVFETLGQGMGGDNDTAKNRFYLSSGIRKKTRRENIEVLKESKSAVVISTQVLEAGVDISFSEIYREVAPLDSIIQVMGRLNREGGMSKATLHLFAYDDEYLPYNELEYRESLKILKKVKSSKDLYDKLPAYYKKISELNASNVGLASKLNRLISILDFKGVNDLVFKEVFADEYDETMIIPEGEEELKGITEELEAMVEEGRRMSRDTFRKYADLTASLPGNPGKLGILGILNEKPMTKGIILPKIGHLAEVYDEEVGLDKWLKA
jgi:CRISPR-associated endonuclease/helicase Cas3